MNKKNGEKSNLIKTAFSRNQANFIFIVIAAVILYACNSSSGNNAHMQQPPPALPVVAVSSMPATTYPEYSASIEGSKDIELRPQVEGYLEKIYVDEGA